MREERVRIAALLPAEAVVVRIGVRTGAPHVVILRIVEQVVDQRAAVIVVDRAVGEHEALEAGEHGLRRRPGDRHGIARAGDRRVDQPEAERDRVDAGAAVDLHVAVRREAAVARRGEHEVVRAEVAAHHIAQGERVAAAEIDHRVGVDLGGARQHVGERRDAGKRREADAVLAAGAGDETEHRVGAVARPIDDEIIAAAAVEEVRAGAAVEQVAAVAAEQPVIAGEAAQRVVDVGRGDRGRQPEDLAVDVDDIEVAARVLAERRRHD